MNLVSEKLTLSIPISKPEVEQATQIVIRGDLGQLGLLLVPAQNAKSETLLNIGD